MVGLKKGCNVDETCYHTIIRGNNINIIEVVLALSSVTAYSMRLAR